MNTRLLLADKPLLGVSALVFAASAILTAVWCLSMAAMPGMEMSGGWVMSMAWMRMPGQGWGETAATFIAMWALMMVAMMWPVLMPELARHRVRWRARQLPLAVRTLSLAAGYFTIWTAAGAAVFPLGVVWAELAMQLPAVSRAVPALTGLLVMAAGVSQFSRWKRDQLDCCWRGEGSASATSLESAWRAGLRYGLRCLYCCAGLTAVLLVIGVMDLWAMALVMMAISAERLMPAGHRVARAVGVVLIFGGSLFLVIAG